MMELDFDSQVKPTEEAVIAELIAVGRPVMSKQGWDRDSCFMAMNPAAYAP